MPVFVDACWQCSSRRQTHRNISNQSVKGQSVKSIESCWKSRVFASARASEGSRESRIAGARGERGRGGGKGRGRRGARTRRYISYARGEVRRRSGGELSTAKAAQGVVCPFTLPSPAFFFSSALFWRCARLPLGTSTGCSSRNDFHQILLLFGHFFLVRKNFFDSPCGNRSHLSFFHQDISAFSEYKVHSELC